MKTILTKLLIINLLVFVVISCVDKPKMSDECKMQTDNSLIFMANGVSFRMLHVEGGIFSMGMMAEQRQSLSISKTTGNLTLSSFYMGSTEVGQALWQAVMGSNPSHFQGNNRPVEMVSWNDCQEFVTKLNEMCKEQLDGKRFCLPTEIEWEYAARGGGNSRGYKYSGGNNIDDVAWYVKSVEGEFVEVVPWYFENPLYIYKKNLSYETHEMATKSPNELGFYDMTGNVEEWCFDKFGNLGNDSLAASFDTTSVSACVIRGGGWDDDAESCNVLYRTSGNPSMCRCNLGFRLLLR